MKVTSHETVLKVLAIWRYSFIWFVPQFYLLAVCHTHIRHARVFILFLKLANYILPHTTKSRQTKCIFALLIIVACHISFDVSTKFKYQTAKETIASNTKAEK